MENSKRKWYEWLVAYVVVFMAIGNLVFAIDNLWAEWVPTYNNVFSVLSDVVMIWAVWRLARGAKASGLKHGVWTAYFCLTVILYLYSWVIPLFEQNSTDDTYLIMSSIYAVLGITDLILGIIIVVELIMKGIKPLNVIMSIIVALPLLVVLIESIILKLTASWMENYDIGIVVAIFTLLSSIVLALLFLHRNDLNKTMQNA